MRTSKGFGAIAVVLLFASLFTMITASVGDQTVMLMHNNSGHFLQRKANFAAYAAMQRCLSDLDKTTQWDLAQKKYYSTWEPGHEITDEEMPGDPETTYTVRLENNSHSAAPATDADGTTIPGGQVYLKVEAEARPEGDHTGRKFTSDIASLGFIGQVYWQHLLLAQRRVTLNSATVDSRDSRNAGGPGGTASDVAVVASNSIKNSIVLKNSHIKGKVRWGPLAPEIDALDIDDNSSVSGDKAAAESLYRIPRFKPPYNPKTVSAAVTAYPGMPQTLTPGAYEGLYVANGATVLLKCGTYDDDTGKSAPQYYFADSVVVEAGGKIELASNKVNERVEVYVGERFVVNNGGQVNPWKHPAYSRPSRMQIMFVGNGGVHSTQQLVASGSGTQVCAVTLGPGLQARVTDGALYFGAIRAFDISVDGGRVSWDRATSSLDSRIRGQLAWTLQGLVEEKAPTMDADFGQPQQEPVYDPYGFYGADYSYSYGSN